MCMRRVYTILASKFIYSSVLIHKFNRKFGGNGFETTDKFRPITSFVCLFVCLFEIVLMYEMYVLYVSVFQTHTLTYEYDYEYE